MQAELARPVVEDRLEIKPEAWVPLPVEEAAKQLHTARGFGFMHSLLCHLAWGPKIGLGRI